VFNRVGIETISTNPLLTFQLLLSEALDLLTVQIQIETERVEGWIVENSKYPVDTLLCSLRIA